MKSKYYPHMSREMAREILIKAWEDYKDEPCKRKADRMANAAMMVADYPAPGTTLRYLAENGLISSVSKNRGNK